MENRPKGSNEACGLTYVLQSLAVFVHCLGLWSVVYSPLILYYLLFHTSYWYLVLIYLAWVYYDRETPFTTGRPWEYMRSSLYMKYFAAYFPIKIVKTAEITNDRNYLFVVHPHGLMVMGVAGAVPAGFYEHFPGIEALTMTLDLNLYMPLAREYFLSVGCRSASERSMLNYLNSGTGKCLCIIPGGVEEMILTQPGAYHIVLNRRKGFVRVALKTGASLIPVVSFGENAVISQYQNNWVMRIQKVVKQIAGFTLAFPKGRGLFQKHFGLMPHSTPINMVVGSPISLPKIENPTKEDINKYHEIYKHELKELFEKYKHEYEPTRKNVELIIH